MPPGGDPTNVASGAGSSKVRVCTWPSAKSRRSSPRGSRRFAVLIAAIVPLEPLPSPPLPGRSATSRCARSSTGPRSRSTPCTRRSARSPTASRSARSRRCSASWPTSTVFHASSPATSTHRATRAARERSSPSPARAQAPSAGIRRAPRPRRACPGRGASAPWLARRIPPPARVQAHDRSWMAPPGYGWRLDHVIASAELEPVACEYVHDWRDQGLSDHSVTGRSYAH